MYKILQQDESFILIKPNLWIKRKIKSKKILELSEESLKAKENTET